MVSYKRFTIIFSLICLFLLSNNHGAIASSNIDPNTSQEQERPLKLVGQGTMRWLWLDIYEALLWTPSGTYQAQQWPLSLELIYSRNISREQLLQSTEEEWQRQGINYQSQWLTQLNSIWPDINRRDKLLLKVNPKGQSQFFYNDHSIGHINDVEFSAAFTAIWLSNNTLQPSLRNQLIGLTP